MSGQPSYHDLYVTTASIPRTRLFDLPYGYEVCCTRVTGWQLWTARARGALATAAGGAGDGSSGT